MVNLQRQVEAETQNILRTLEALKTVLLVEKKTTTELAAISTYLLNIYNGIENILKQVLKSKGVKIHRSEAWHKELLDVSIAQGIMTEKLADELREYLAFRHFFIHSYGFMLKEERIKGLTDKVFNVWAAFSSRINEILKESES